MSNRDEFDPEGFQSAFGKIADAMEQGRSGIRQRGPMIGVMTVAVALFVLFAVFWSTYPRGDDAKPGDGPVPIIRADATPYKTAPDDPGGMEIPYRDSTIFETIREAENNTGDSRVESLLPPPEEPIAREQMFAGLKTEALEAEDAAKIAPAPALDAGPMPVASEITDEHKGEILPEQKIAGQKVAEQKVAEIAPPPAPAVEEEKAAKTEPAAGDATVKAVPNASSGTHYIQLGSVKDRSGAEAEWKKLQKEFPAQLGSLTLRVQSVDLGAKGIFYRIQGGSVAQAQAKEICTAIAAKRPGGCIVVAR